MNTESVRTGRLSAWIASLTLAVACGTSSAAQPAGPTPNPFLAPTYNNQTHWDDAASDSMSITVPRGRYELTEQALQWLPNESMSLPHTMGKMGGRDVYFWWAGFSLRKLTLDGGKLTEVGRLDLPAALPNFRDVGPEGRRAQASAVQGFLERRDEAALAEYMRAQPNRMTTGSSDQALAGSIYALLTRDNAFVGCSARRVFRIDQADPEQPASAMRLTSNVALPATLFDDERVKVGQLPVKVDLLFGLGMTFNGFLVVNTLGGKVATLDRRTLAVIDTFTTPAGELFMNSFATGPEAGGGAVYVASNTAMYRLAVDDQGRIHADESRGAWRTPYERGVAVGAPKIGDGTGSTPTLVGFGPDEDRLVVITDGARKMRLVAFWRDGIPAGWQQRPGTLSPRIADQREVDLGPGFDTVQSEQSVSAWGPYAFVVNNMSSTRAAGAPHENFLSMTVAGATRPGPTGVAAMKWDHVAHRWQPLWARTDVSSITIVPMISGGGRMAVIDGFFAERWNDRHHIGMDLDTGETVMTLRTGTDPRLNGMFAPIKVDPQGNLFYGMAFGLVHVDFRKARRLDDGR